MYRYIVKCDRASVKSNPKTLNLTRYMTYLYYGTRDKIGGHRGGFFKDVYPQKNALYTPENRGSYHDATNPNSRGKSQSTLF